MAYTKKNEVLNVDDLFGEFLEDLGERSQEAAGESSCLNILDFINQEISLGSEFELTRAQILLLKLCYGLELDEEDQLILDVWQEQERTTWHEGKVNIPQVLVIEAGRRCLADHSFVYTDKGLLTFKELVEGQSFDDEGWSDLSSDLNVAQEDPLSVSKVKRYFKLGEKPTKKLTTKHGYSIEGTPEHRIKVFNKDGKVVWKFIGEVQKGDKACIRRGTQLFSKDYFYIPSSYIPDISPQDTPIEMPSYVDEKMGYFLGALVGDGSWTKKASIELTTSLDDLDYWSCIFSSLFPDRKVNLAGKKDTNATTIRFFSKRYRKLLEHLGWSCTDRYSKCTPHSIRKSPKSVVAAYLSGLFDTDGGMEKGNTISFSTACQSLAEETQLLLLNFGIVSRLKPKIINDREYYIVSLLGSRSNVLFYEQINFSLPRKKAQLESYIQGLSKQSNIYDTTPYQLERLQELREALPTFNKSTKTTRPYRTELRKILGNAIKPGSSNNDLSLDKLTKLVEWLEEINLKEVERQYKYFRNLLDLNYFYEEIVSIEESEATCYDLEVPETSAYVAQGFTSHNSGKSTLAAIIGVYEFYCLCKLKCPQEFYKIAASTPISILILATSADQAKKTIFRQVTMLIENGPYFKHLISKGKIVIKTEEIAYAEKGLYVQSGNSRSASQVGGTLKCMIMDEVARFRSQEGESNAMTLWSNLGISCAPFKEHAKRIAISSAWEEEDAIEVLYKTTDSSPFAMGFKFRSWDLNTNISRDNPLVAYEYSLDPDKAALEFEGIRPTAQNAFLPEFYVEKSVRGRSQITASPEVSKDGLRVMRIHYCARRTSSDSVIHIDPGIKKDAYAMALGHGEKDKQGRLLVVIDALLCWEPDYDHEVSMSDVGDNILKINKLRGIEYLSADHYNSQETIQRMKRSGINAEVVYFSNKQQLLMYTALRSILTEGRLILPKDSIWSPVAARELKRVRLINGVKIDHPPGESKDLADAIASVAYRLNQKAHVQVGEQKISKYNPETQSHQASYASQGIIVGVDGTPLSSDNRQKALSKLKSRQTWSKDTLKTLRMRRQ